MHREDLKECGCDSTFKDKSDCDFTKTLEPWERPHAAREKEKKDALEKDRKEKGRAEKYKDKSGERERNEKSILEKCQKDKEFEKCFKEKKDGKEKHKDTHSKDRKTPFDQLREKKEKAFSSLISEDFSERKDDRKGKEKSWYIADIFTDESEDEKEECVASSFKTGETGDSQRAESLQEKEDGREHPSDRHRKASSDRQHTEKPRDKEPKEKRKDRGAAEGERTRRKRSSRSTKKRKIKSVQRNTRKGKTEPLLTLPQKRRINRNSLRR